MWETAEYIAAVEQALLLPNIIQQTIMYRFASLLCISLKCFKVFKGYGQPPPLSYETY